MDRYFIANLFWTCEQARTYNSILGSRPLERAQTKMKAPIDLDVQSQVLGINMSFNSFTGTGAYVRPFFNELH